MDITNLQQDLFAQIRTRAPENPPLAEIIAVLLEISTDSAYRRIRGEKPVTIDELYKLCMHFQISVDQLMHIPSKGVLFQGRYLDRDNFRFEDYMISLVKEMTQMNGFKEKMFYYSCKDIPVFHHFHFRELAAFKWFFWLKTYFQFPEFSKRKFRVEEYPEEILQLNHEAVRLYNQIPSVEIWNIESMNIIFRQIDFYREARVFESDRDVLKLYEVIENLWNYLEKQAALGYKFMVDDPAQTPMGSFSMYFNEVLLGDNNMLVVMDGAKLCYLTHSTINFMQTRDLAFCDNLYKHFQNQMKKSTLISEVSEKERSRFFRIIRDRILARKENLKV